MKFVDRFSLIVETKLMLVTRTFGNNLFSFCRSRPIKLCHWLSILHHPSSLLCMDMWYLERKGFMCRWEDSVQADIVLRNTLFVMLQYRVSQLKVQRNKWSFQDDWNFYFHFFPSKLKVKRQDCVYSVLWSHSTTGNAYKTTI